ncbi:PREDICTED: WD repeat-containing protein 60 [Habropoda laboriosa]|uniref:WD repeat-containing protein 60 n=1 Tax=Habropoda laboriosa TaxID=597456 RepID=UPI00083D4292|nr:PREDICTED: WD repeat-containing protein 60 [Habropoda laboriosa]
MSHKGAIKKVSTTRDRQQSSVRTKSKNSSSKTDDSEKVELKLIRTSQTLEKKKENESYLRLTQNVQASKSSTKSSVRSPKTVPFKETSSLTSKSNVNNSRISSKSILTSKTSTDHLKTSTSNNAIKNSKSSSGRIQSSYSEKRGLSTIFVPQSALNKLNTKLPNKNNISTSKSQEQVRIHSSALETTESKIKSRQRKLSRTLSPSEVKMLHSAISRPDSSQTLDQTKKKQLETPQIDNEYNYEDDFEDYESDFQECTDSETSEVSEETSNNHSNLPLDPIELHTAKQPKIVNSAEHKEEEHMHDSGHYELTEARKRAARIESIAHDPKLSSLLEIRQPINKSYSEEKSENKSLPLSTDEGFEDSRSGDFTKSPPISQISFIDFRKIKEEQKPKESKKILSRGEELLEMIKLDVMEWSLLECSPIPYEEFIRSYGKLNAQQVSTQTGEDNIDTETQTEEIMFKNKWTQFPITCRKDLKTKEDLDLFRTDQIGVGSDSSTETMNFLPLLSFDILRLSDFMNRAGKVMLSLLEERRSGGNVFKNEEQIAFSDGVVRLSVNSVTFLAGRAVTIIHYSEVLNKILMTVHSPVEEEIETSNKQDYITDCCIGCVWNTSEPSTPIKLFYSTCPITACCFHLTNYNVVFAGLQDGSISLWDLKEDEMWHHKITDKANELDWTIRMPTYTTATKTEINTQISQIVAIRILSKIEEKSLEHRNNKFVPIQICSLNENGSLIIWSVLHNMGKNIDDLGLSLWGSIRLVKSQELLLQSSKKKNISAAAFINMHVDCIDTNNLYIVTNSSSILHATSIGNKANPAVYTKLDTNPSGNVTCIETCPFEQSFFLVSCDDGTIRLHSLNIEKPILQLRDEDNTCEIKSIQWSKTKPFLIFVLDNNSCIHIWDLSSSDIYPTCKVNMQKNGCIKCMQLSSCKTKREMSCQYLALGMESGNVEIHKLKTNFYYSKKEDYLQELNTFMQYVKIL